MAKRRGDMLFYLLILLLSFPASGSSGGTFWQLKIWTLRSLDKVTALYIHYRNT